MDIVERLRTMNGMGDIQFCALLDGVGPKAADEIERLRTEVDTLKVVMVGYEKQRDELIRVSEKRDALAATVEQLDSGLTEIAEYAHQESSGPVMPDALWEVRCMAYDRLAYQGPAEILADRDARITAPLQEQIDALAATVESLMLGRIPTGAIDGVSSIVKADDILATRDARVRAAALREAADKGPFKSDADRWVATELRRMADAIRAMKD